MSKFDTTSYGFEVLSKSHPNGIKILHDTRPINYANREYETLIDSKGNKHEVQVGYKDAKYFFNEEDLVFDTHGVNHKMFKYKCSKFNYNLTEYYLLYQEWQSPFQVIGSTIIKNEMPEKLSKKIDLIKYISGLTGYMPIFELVWWSGNGHAIQNFLPDKYFYSFKDRVYAANHAIGLHNYKHPLVSDGWENMNDDEAFDYVREISIRKAKFMKKIRSSIN